jgi:hypothetical protein
MMRALIVAFALAVSASSTRATAATTLPSTQSASQPADLRRIIATLQQQIATLKAENQKLKAQIASFQKQSKKRDQEPPDGMYDAMKSPHSGDGGMSLNGSTLRPENPLAAYEMVKKDQSFDEVMGILGGYQNDRETDNVRTVEWLFVTGAGGEIRMTIRFKDGKVVSKSKDSRG